MPTVVALQLPFSRFRLHLYSFSLHYASTVTWKAYPYDPDTNECSCQRSKNRMLRVDNRLSLWSAALTTIGLLKGTCVGLTLSSPTMNHRHCHFRAIDPA
ncbi:hypothetical protein K461DRAFT_279420 [Myriangium duriaei CBS 260.36]|uniref:Uncharacterized protein n=1 Tax=Myriangium duriaei CBS 260.36 TaxID=1168546 RepID=A0A9P4J1V2_9PEZI|nr:hypothetical protein K461DRAFT_279420 [Myriangium duriaei CBS 260.36]